jgi:hypothetical protein
MARLVAVLDANAPCIPPGCGTSSMRLAIAGMFQPRWTTTILDECFDNISADRPDLTAEQLNRTRHLMAVAVPDARSSGREPEGHLGLSAERGGRRRAPPRPPRPR